MPLTYENQTVVARPVADWRAIWAGVFTFIAIWSVFGFLGLAIFASAANPNSAQPIMGMSAGMGIWTIALTIIAMYVARRETGRLAAVTNRHDGLIHRMIMFGLSVGAVMVITALAGGLFGTSTAAGTHNANVLAITANVSWILFVSLFLDGLAARRQGVVCRFGESKSQHDGRESGGYRSPGLGRREQQCAGDLHEF